MIATHHNGPQVIQVQSQQLALPSCRNQFSLLFHDRNHSNRSDQTVVLCFALIYAFATAGFICFPGKFAFDNSGTPPPASWLLILFSTVMLLVRRLMNVCVAQTVVLCIEVRGFLQRWNRATRTSSTLTVPTVIRSGSACLSLSIRQYSICRYGIVREV